MHSWRENTRFLWSSQSKTHLSAGSVCVRAHKSVFWLLCGDAAQTHLASILPTYSHKHFKWVWMTYKSKHLLAPRHRHSKDNVCLGGCLYVRSAEGRAQSHSSRPHLNRLLVTNALLSTSSLPAGSVVRSVHCVHDKVSEKYSDPAVLLRAIWLITTQQWSNHTLACPANELTTYSFNLELFLKAWGHVMS